MKRFNLEEYLKNPSKKIVTRDGKAVRIICTDREDSIYPIVALIQDNNRESEFLAAYTKDGIPAEYTEVYYTLFFVPEKKEGWLNIYLDAENSGYVGTCIYKSKEEAEESGKKWSCYITTLKIEWEE